MIARVRLLTALSVLALTLWPLGLLAQNTAPVPTTFEIISPPDGNASSLINTDFSANKRVFYGGDFFYTNAANAGGFLGHTDPGNKNGTKIAAGNASGSRLTLGGTEEGADPDFPDAGGATVANLPGGHAAGDFDPDDLGSGAVALDYSGENGFIAINEGDTLEINISGFIDPNNKLLQGDQIANSNYSGRYLKSQNGNGTSGFDGANNVTFTALNLPAGATFVGNRLRWVPSFVQGDGATDNSVRGGRFFVDANISNGSTASETAATAGDTSRSATKVGQGVGELRDSLYVIYFKATDDSNQGSDNAIDSLFIMVNDSLPNPPPSFTRRTMLRKDSLGVSQTRSFNYLAGVEDTLFSVFEGDSVVLTFYAQDQDSLQGETNDNIAFGLLWNDDILGVNKGGTTNGAISGFNQFIHRPGTVDTLLADTVSTLSGGVVPNFRIKLQVPFNLATTDEKADTLVVMVSDGATIKADTFALKVRNTNRAPIWDGNLTSLPSDSVLVFSPSPAVSRPDSIQTVGPFTLNNNQTDSTNFSRYVFDPDFLIGDSAGYPLSYSASGNHKGSLNSSTGLNVFLPSVEDTVTYSFTVTATDNNTVKKSTAQQVRFRVAPAPSISRVEPAKGSVNHEFTIYGSGFGLFDRNSEDTSKVVFYATDLNGNRQNIAASIISWAKDKIVASVPSGVPVSRLDNTLSYLVPDTIKVVSAIYGGFDTYPFTVLTDSSGYENIEIVNITSTSAMLRYRTNFSGADSIVVAASSDTLDIHSAAFTTSSKFNGYPTFVEYNSGLSEIRSSVTVFKDETSADDGIHIIQLSSLSPGTLYRFFICSANGVFAADSLRNVNGPYRAKKVDRATAGNNSSLTAFALRTLPTGGANGSMYMLKGKACYSGGSATNATVRLKVVDNSSISDTSLPLVVTVGSDSLWELNLANLRKSDGSGFNHSQGDYLLFEFDGAEKGFEQYDTLRAADAASPMTINNVKLVPFVNYDLELKTGLNLIGIPLYLFKGQPSTAKALLGKLYGGTPSITRYVTSTGVQETITRAISGQYVGASDFNLAIEEGYFVRVNSANNIKFDGRAYTRKVPVIQFPGAGQYFVSRPAQDATLFRSWDASSVLKSVSGIKAIFRYNAHLQEYREYFRQETGSYSGENFGIDVGQGYIFEVSAASSWDPNGTGTLLASDNNGSGGSMPSIRLDLNSNAVAGGAFALRVSNVTSAAAVFTWTASAQATGVLRLTDPDGKEIVVQPKTLEGGFSYALVTGLKDEAEYRYAVEGLSGLPSGSQTTGRLTTAQMGAGLNPYTLYGRLTDNQDKPLAGMLVFLKLTSAENGLQTGALCAVTDVNGSWVLNLANFKENGSGLPYSWAVGDKMELTVQGRGFERTFSSTVKAESPHNFALDLQGASGDTDMDDATVTQPVALPKAFSLAQNSPNPFNPSTTIRYAVPEGAGQIQVRLDVFNLRGQLVRNLVSALRGPGDYGVEWDGTDSAGRRASSGIYFYRLTTPSFKATRKMIILK